ncbi:thiamine pyrophosphate-binding protein [Aciditerrimonas ferrireducens]|uniref:Thiamine pyrophosphate-binding protein n=1 Tax=Aciditerrimonas ferrireducens TaxID=667306 RepID=A0ABV6C449_9ACTN
MANLPATEHPGRPERRVREALADAFVAEGLTTVFGLMGDGTKRWMLDMAARGARVVQVRHEGAGCAMADGAARATGQPALCAVTYGPGVSQLSTALLVAAKHRTPLVVFAADVPTHQRDRKGQLDVSTRQLLEAAHTEVHEVLPGQDPVDLVRRAVGRARCHGRPVAVLAAPEVQELLAPPPTGPRRPPIDRPVAVPHPEVLTETARRLTSASRPVLLAGAGAARAGAGHVLAALADRLGARLATSFGAKGLFDPHPANLGLAGGFALPATKEALACADLLLAVGASLNDHTTDRGQAFPRARVLLVDQRPDAALEATVPLDAFLLGDARLVTEQLLAALPDRPPPAAPWRSGVAVVDASGDLRRDALRRAPLAVEPHRLDPRVLMLALDEALPEDALVVVGGGHHMGFAAQYLTNRSGRRRFLMAFDFMTTGQAVPTAIGAALARPERPVVAIEGDASFLMHVQELETAARVGARLLVVVVDDQALGAEVHALEAEGLDPSLALVPTPDLARLAEALGGRGRRVDHLTQVASLPGWFDPTHSPPVPHVVDCLVSRRVVGPG